MVVGALGGSEGKEQGGCGGEVRGEFQRGLLEEEEGAEVSEECSGELEMVEGGAPGKTRGASGGLAEPESRSGPGSGPGAGPGAGPGERPGDGPGAGPGAGPGSGPGTGPGARPGPGLRAGGVTEAGQEQSVPEVRRPAAAAP